MKQYLTPSIDDIRMECVLMQAWKKTSAYLRSHSWYADTLGLDYQSLRISKFIREIQERLQEPENWQSAPLAFVPAPKSQQWRFRNDIWEPNPKNKIADKIRPLAHVHLQDQVVATALLMCLADRVESYLGDPRLSSTNKIHRHQILAYGHRLFCDSNGTKLSHRWGTTKLYRQYFQDYQTFLKRPKIVADQISKADDGIEIAIVQSDFSKFYDRVRPQMLAEKMRQFMESPDELPFFNFAERVLNWSWADKDRALKYANRQSISDFHSIALPQGLVSAGFFANIALMDFDRVIRRAFDTSLDTEGNLVLADACYYVDDIRLVLKIKKGLKENVIEKNIILWLQKLLNETAPLLKVERSKTQATVEGRQQLFLVAQSEVANKIQKTVSGPFDMMHGANILNTIEGFFHTQKQYSTEQKPEENGRAGLLVGTSDMRDDTAARFAAGKFRRTFRSLRPLLEEVRACEINWADNQSEEETGYALPGSLLLTKQQLDERAQLFSALLIEEWIINPGNVRLLRIALDIYPEETFLSKVLSVLQPAWKPQGARGPHREIRAYCLAEIFRAGATETGIVSDKECLPTNVSIEAYHERLIQEARCIIKDFLTAAASPARFPWYLMQQVFLYLIARNAFPDTASLLKTKGGDAMLHYRKFVKFLTGQPSHLLEERSIFYALARTGFGHTDFEALLAGTIFSEEYFFRLNEISPSIAIEVWSYLPDNEKSRLLSVAIRLGLEPDQSDSTLSNLAAKQENPFFEEENLLSLADWLFGYLPGKALDMITPWQIKCEWQPKDGYKFGKIQPKSFEFLRASKKAEHLFKPPDWCESEDDRIKFQIGQLLRFALRGSNNLFGNFSDRSSNMVPRYKRPVSHWEQQRYSGYQGRSAFGPPWLPISSFTENLLFELLRWPGSGIQTKPKPLLRLQKGVEERLAELKKQRGKISSTTFLRQSAGWPTSPPKTPWFRPLRIGIVQSVLPRIKDFEDHSGDPELIDDRTFRGNQRRHLAAMMEGVGQMLRIRETHVVQNRCDDRVIDLLAFPELAIHPQDIDSIVLPFIRDKKCIMIFGQVYHKQFPVPAAPIINSCLWLIPEWNRASGFSVKRIEQGKQHLANNEKQIPGLVGFRPAQWLIEYQWHSDEQYRPLILTSSICYDATDLALASDLKSRSDLYFVCALNQDVGTFDRMSEGLHFHMFQGLIVVNNGEFGGSNCYMPFEKPYHRQVLHLHGQPQATIAFTEISPQKLIERPLQNEGEPPFGLWKTPPAGS